jgi:hypothetical protein
MGAIVAAAVLAGGSGPDKAACKEAMRAQFVHGMEHPDDPEGRRPAECQGVSDEDLQRFTSEILDDYVTSGS